MMKHKHKFEPAPDHVGCIEINGRWRNTRIQREQCECGAWWNNPIHLSAAERGDEVEGYGVFWTNDYQDPEIYEDEYPRAFVVEEV